MGFIQLFKLQSENTFSIAEVGWRISSRAILVVALSLSWILFNTHYALALNEPQGGSIKGKVVGDIPDQRKPLSGVVVHLKGDPTANKQFQAVSDVSDEEGQYTFAGLLAGDYVISVEFQGFKKYEQKISCADRCHGGT